MRSFFTLLLLGVLFSAHAKTYYFSASGDDSRTATQAQSQSTPWKSISKLNAIFSILQPGDYVLFKRGDVFYGSIIISKSGTASAPITFGAYGSGARPVITGYLTLSKWTSIGGGKYSSTNSSLGAVINTVGVNGFSKAMGRYPNSNAANKGYLNFESHGTNSITDKELSSSPDWTGAELVIRTNHYVLDRVKVTDQVGTTLKYSPATTYTPKDGFGYFFQNDLRTLDQLGEWYYKPSTKTFYMYFGSNSPSNYKVQASSVTTVIDLYNQDNITFDNLTISGANVYGFNIYSSDNTRIQNCDIIQSGIDGIYAMNTTALDIENCNILNSNNIGVYLCYNTNASKIRNNVIRNTAVFAGMGQNGSNQSIGLRINGNNNLVEYNRIDSTGCIPIRFTGDYATIKNNFINYFTFVKDDGGGIYTSGGTSNTGRKITGNIILNGIGAKEGTTNSVVQQSSGIYIDMNATGISITGNTIANCGKVGIYIHDTYKITITGNTCYNNTGQSLLCHDNKDFPSLTNVILKNNIFVSKTTSQKVAMFYTVGNDISTFGKFDSNYYARPIDDNVTLEAITGLYIPGSQVKTNHTLATWKSKYTMYDMMSKKAPRTFDSTLNPDNYIRFEYNPSQTSKTISLSTTYVDVKNKTYSGSITLAPYASIILIKAGLPSVTITSPKLNATYSAPASVQVSASASDPDGTISKVQFYNGSTLIKTLYSSPYSWTWSNVSAGTYKLVAKATDNSGNITSSTAVSFTVKSSSLTTTALADTTTNTGQISESAPVKESPAQPSFDFRLYPNPAVNSIFLAFTNEIPNGAKATITIQSVSGSILKQIPVTLSDNRMQVDISSFSSGMYIISLSTDKFKMSRKFTKMSD